MVDSIKLQRQQKELKKRLIKKHEKKIKFPVIIIPSQEGSARRSFNGYGIARKSVKRQEAHKSIWKD